MALIKCPECQTEVSSLAASCPKCAAPIAQRSTAKAVGQQVTTTERTSKRIKMHVLLSLLTATIGFMLLFLMEGQGKVVQGVGGAMALVGLVWFLTTRVRAWWHHG